MILSTVIRGFKEERDPGRSSGDRGGGFDRSLIDHNLLTVFIKDQLTLRRNLERTIAPPMVFPQPLSQPGRSLAGVHLKTDPINRPDITDCRLGTPLWMGIELWILLTSSRTGLSSCFLRSSAAIEPTHSPDAHSPSPGEGPNTFTHSLWARS